VVYVRESGITHHLTKAATAVWQCLDGRTPLAELAEDLAAATGWNRRAVEAELLEVVHGFGRDGLLDRGAPTRGERVVEEVASEAQTPEMVRVPPSECAERSDLPWEATTPVRVGRYVIGVRSGTTALDRLVTAMVDGHVLSGVRAPPNCSLRLASTDGLRFHRLFRGCETSVRTRSLHRLLRALSGFLAEYAVEDDPTAVHLDALVLVHGGEALLLPAELRPLLPAEDALRRRGLQVLDAATAAIEPGSGDLEVQQPLFEVDEALLAETAHLAAEPTEAMPQVEPGRYRVRTWAYLATGKDERGPAEVVAAANRRVRNRAAVGAQTALTTLADLASTAPLMPVRPGDPTGVVLDRLLD